MAEGKGYGCTLFSFLCPVCKKYWKENSEKKRG